MWPKISSHAGSIFWFYLNLFDEWNELENIHHKGVHYFIFVHHNFRLKINNITDANSVHRQK
jgi:hypothetical protein